MATSGFAVRNRAHRATGATLLLILHRLRRHNSLCLRIAPPFPITGLVRALVGILCRWVFRRHSWRDGLVPPGLAVKPYWRLGCQPSPWPLRLRTLSVLGDHSPAHGNSRSCCCCRRLRPSTTAIRHQASSSSTTTGPANVTPNPSLEQDPTGMALARQSLWSSSVWRAKRHSGSGPSAQTLAVK